eukprot:Skav205311  [mRNA]  locus=scaffold3444:122952:123763:+ [translate_table: standard]
MMLQESQIPHGDENDRENSDIDASQRIQAPAESRSFNRSHSGTPVQRRLQKYPSGCTAADLDWLGREDEPVSLEEILRDEWDVDEGAEVASQMPVTGPEIWLDALLLALEEKNMTEESSIVAVLQTVDLQGLQPVPGKLKGKKWEKLLTFYGRLDKVLKILKNKAGTRYFQHLQRASEQRQDLIDQQNEVLHDYVCELEHEFSEVSKKIATNEEKKDFILSNLSVILDPKYSQLEGSRI